MKIKYLFCVFVYFSILSCKDYEKTFHVIDIKKDSFIQANLSEIIDTIIAIPLETTDECLLLENFRLLRDDSLLFIENNGEIFLFGTNGKFHKQLTHKGNGPGETWVYGFDLNKKDKQLVVNGRGKKILCYKYDGTLVSQKTLELSDFYFRPFMIFDNYIWTIANRSIGNESWILKFNEQWDLEDSIKLFTPKMPKEIFTFFYYHSFSVIDSSLYVNHPSHNTDHIQRDTLFEVVGNNLIPILRINYGDYTYRTREVQNPNKTGYPIQQEIIKINKRFLMTKYVINNEQENSFDSFAFYYDFVTKKSYNLKEGFDDDIYFSGKVIPISMDIYNEEFYFTKNTNQLLKLFPDREESDNPVVFILKLKKKL